MATIEKYDTAHGSRYRVRYRTPDRSQSSKRAFKTKKEAVAWAATLEVSINRGEYIDPNAGKVPVADLATRWLENKKASMKPSSYRVLEVTYAVYVEPRWGRTPIQGIKPSAVETWIAEMSAGTAVTVRKRKRGSGTGEPTPVSATVVLRALGVLAGVLDSAVRDGRLAKNPARGATNRPRKVSNKARRYLTHAEVVSLAEATPTEMHRALIMTLAYTGLRWGEAVGLRVRDLNMLRRRIHVSRAAVEVGGKVEVGLPKSHENRSVPFPSFLTAPLSALCVNKGPDDLVFAGRFGSYLRRPDTSTGAVSWFTTALDRAGLERLTPHDLRHTAASLAISSGAHVKAVQRMLGHKSAAMTLDTYADLFDDDLDAVAERMEAGALGANVSKLWPQADSVA